jgi:SAM-dependent methyltransferase
MLTTRPLRKMTAPVKPNVFDTLNDTAAPLRDERHPSAYSALQRKDSGYHPRAQSRDVPTILHVGCGSKSPARLHEFFRRSAWNEVRCDIDPDNQPEIVASITNLRGHVDDGSCDAVWASHIIEHLARHEVPQALSEFVRILSPSGFALIRSPDIEIVAQFIVEGRINDVIYTSSAGPITPLDMIYGHGAAIAQQKTAMRHGTAFTQELLGNDLLAAGFSEVRTTRTRTYEVWAVAFMPEADVESTLEGLAKSGIDFRN